MHLKNRDGLKVVGQADKEAIQRRAGMSSRVYSPLNYSGSMIFTNSKEEQKLSETVIRDWETSFG